MGKLDEGTAKKLLESLAERLAPSNLITLAGDAKPSAPIDVEDVTTDWGDAKIPLIPKGPADITGIHEFLVHILAGESLYAMPAVKDIPPPVRLVFQAAAHRYRAVASQYAAMGYKEAPLSFMEGIFDRYNKQEKQNKAAAGKSRTLKAWTEYSTQLASDVQQVTTFLLDGVAAGKSEEDLIDTVALRNLAKKLDGLIDIKGYDFDIFQPGTINLGIRLIYRQAWEPEAYQVGELLNTLPLTPGEKVRIETKAWETTKTTREINESTTYSTEEVLSTTNRDVTEVMRHASKKWGLKQEGSGGVDFKIWHAEGKTAFDVERSNESKYTKQAFREIMSKSAESFKNERKVTISVAKEGGSETKVTREIANTNDEITVTYLFYELQRRYKVREYLYDVVPVVYVAMDVPSAAEVNEAWVRRHDWLIAGAVLDKSFIEPLSFITSEWPGLMDAYEYALAVYNQAMSVVEDLRGQITTIEEDLADVENFGDLIEDIRLRTQLKPLAGKLKSALDAVAAAQKELRSAEVEKKRGEVKVFRLLDHIRKNILHYMKAVWDSEVPEQRYLRLRSVLYPVTKKVGGIYAIEKWIPLVEVIDADQPLGYLGNYAIFRLNRGDHPIVRALGAPYFAPGPRGTYIIRDPDGDKVEDGKIYIPTDAVYAEALPGTHPLLETFKLQHRKADVEKARQEVVQQALENLRRLLLLSEDRTGDPVVEKMVIAGSELVDKMADGVVKD